MWSSVGLPAVYQQFGEQLLYMDGTIFDASDPSRPPRSSMWPTSPTSGRPGVRLAARERLLVSPLRERKAGEERAGDWRPRGSKVTG